MTKISAIAGVGSVQEKVFVPKPNFNYQDLTDGELTAQLIARQYEIVGTVNKDDQLLELAKTIKKAAKDLHETGINIPGNPYISSVLNNAAAKTYPASAANFMNKSSVAGFDFAEYSQKEREVCQQIKDNWENTSWLRFARRTELKAKWQACFTKLDYLNSINLHLESGSYQPLYNFVENPLDVTTIVQVKRTSHRNFVSVLSDLSGLSRENVALWIRNGVIASSAENGNGAAQPEVIIETMKVRIPQAGIGFIDPLTISAIAGIVSAIVAALKAIVILIQSLLADDRTKLLSTSQGLGTPTWGPEQEDWITSISNQTGIDIESLLLPAAGAALLYYLT